MRAPMKKWSAIMKKFLLSAAAASMVAIPLMAAAPAEAAPRHKTTVVKHKANGRTVIKQRKVVRRPVQRTVRYQTSYRPAHEVGRASCRERVCQDVEISGAARSGKQKKRNK